MTPSSEEALPPAPGDEALAGFAARCNAIEEAYEFMLAYAAQGLPDDAGSASGSQIRDFLRKCDAALTGLGDAITRLRPAARHSVAAPYDAFISVVDRDVRERAGGRSARARAAVNRLAARGQPERLHSPARACSPTCFSSTKC